jgi:acetyl esterase/lipase
MRVEFLKLNYDKGQCVMKKWLIRGLKVLAVILVLMVVGGWLYWQKISHIDSERLEDIPYASAINEAGEDEVLDLDIYLPADMTGEKKPAIIWFHGGGFAPVMNKRQIYILMLADEFAKRGYVNISVEYRRRWKPFSDIAGTLSDAVSDGQQAVDWIIKNAEKYNIDNERLVIGGGSAGGILVGNLVHNDQNPLTMEDGFIAVLNLWGPIANEDYRIINSLSDATPPTLLIHGTADNRIDYQESEKYLAQLQALGVPAQLNLLEGGGHPPMDHMDQIYDIIDEYLKKQP